MWICAVLTLKKRPGNMRRLKPKGIEKKTSKPYKVDRLKMCYLELCMGFVFGFDHGMFWTSKNDRWMCNNDMWTCAILTVKCRQKTIKSEDGGHVEDVLACTMGLFFVLSFQERQVNLYCSHPKKNMGICLVFWCKTMWTWSQTLLSKTVSGEGCAVTALDWHLYWPKPYQT